MDIYVSQVKIDACSICGKPVSEPVDDTEAGSKFGFCPSDDAPYHLSCWQYIGGCGNLQCPSNPGQTPSGALRQLQNLQPCVSKEEQRIRDIIQQLTQAIRNDDDELIEHIWNQENNILETRTEIRPYRNRIKRAAASVQAYRKLHDAILSDQSEHIVTVYITERAALESCNKFSTAERERVERAYERVLSDIQAEYQRGQLLNSDIVLSALYERYEGCFKDDHIKSHVDIQQLKLSQLRNSKLQELRGIIASNNHTRIARYFIKNRDILLDSRELSWDERNSVWQIVQTVSYRNFEKALTQKDPEKLVLAGDAFLQAGGTFSEEDMSIFQAAKDTIPVLFSLTQAIEQNNDSEILSIWQQHLPLIQNLLPPNLKQIIEQVQTRALLVQQLRYSIHQNDLKKIVEIYTSNQFSQSNLINPDETDFCEITLTFVQFLEKARDELNSNNDARIVEISKKLTPDMYQYLTFSERQRIHLAIQRVNFLKKIKTIEENQDIEALVQEYQTAWMNGLDVEPPGNWNSMINGVLTRKLFHKLLNDLNHDDQWVAFGSWLSKKYPELINDQIKQEIKCTRMILGKQYHWQTLSSTKG